MLTFVVCELYLSRGKKRTHHSSFLAKSTWHELSRCTESPALLRNTNSRDRKFTPAVDDSRVRLLTATAIPCRGLAVGPSG